MSFTIDTRCDGCGACARQCPVEAISGDRRQTHAIDPWLCIDCGVCGAICPQDAIRDETGRVVPRVVRALRARPVFDADRCNGCGLCVTICPFDCLTVEGPAYQGAAWLSAPQRCVSCGECETICLKGAVMMQPLDLRTLDPDLAWKQVREALGLPAEPETPEAA